jgi:hypothetical protein
MNIGKRQEERTQRHDPVTKSIDLLPAAGRIDSGYRQCQRGPAPPGLISAHIRFPSPKAAELLAPWYQSASVDKALAATHIRELERISELSGRDTLKELMDNRWQRPADCSISRTWSPAGSLKLAFVGGRRSHPPLRPSGG